MNKLITILITFLAPLILVPNAAAYQSSNLTSKNKDLPRPSWLPKGSKVVCSSSNIDGLLPDADIRYKIKATKQDFEALTKTLGVTPHKPGRKYTDDKIWLNWGGNHRDPFDTKKVEFAESNWDPSDNIDNTYVHQSQDIWTLLKFENGYIYYLFINH